MEKQEYKEVAAMAANGDSKAFTRLYETIYREMYYTAFYSLADDADAVEVLIDTVRDAFACIGKLHTEAAFRMYMMKQLCAGIKNKFKEYAADGREIFCDENKYRPNRDGIDIKQEFNRLPDTERLVCALYVGGKFLCDEISQFTGLSASTVKKKLDRALMTFSLD
ncbi:MAG: hypothetical protein IJZ95_03460 [Oscillospiraceae bacterium]|nr:hypothetical protein [Oscillospiraceae bacterium]